MTQTKTLVIASYDRRVNNFLRTIIHNVIGGRVRIRGISFEKERESPVPADVVMTSGAFLVPRVQELYPNTPIIGPRRIITGYNLEKVLMLPRGLSVLVVNHPRSASEETIESLANLGINHLNYIPYWKDGTFDEETTTTAISPGMAHLCPRGIERIIDIGPRIISILSFLKLLLALGLDVSYLEDFATYHHNFLMESSRKLAGVLEHSELLRTYQEIILNEFEDGLLLVNSQGKIDLANASAEKLLSRGGRELASSGIAAVLARLQRIDGQGTLADTERKTSAIYTFAGKKLLVNKIRVAGDKSSGSVYTLKRIESILRLEKDVRIRLSRKGYVTKYDFSDIWCASAAMNAVIEKARRFARTEKNILIIGESGTGKELFAHALHRNSPRRDGPFVAVNFAGIPETLIESELFGYEPGAFTGATRSGKAGLFEEAHGGTIFLDEIGDAPLSVQSRLLRVIQEKEVMRVGGTKIIPVDVRVLAGTNRDLPQEMAEKRFRSDLYYRLSTLPLQIPPLREHKEDIIHILTRYLEVNYGITIGLSSEVAACLLAHNWPGNVRELVNTADYLSVIAAASEQVEIEHLPEPIIRRRNNRSTHMDDHQILVFRQLARDLAGGRNDGEVFFHLLHAFSRRKNLLSGRKTLIEELGRQGIVVTEAKMKRYLQVMKAADLVHVGTTKQGTSLTQKGEDFCRYLAAAASLPPRASPLSSEKEIRS